MKVGCVILQVEYKSIPEHRMFDTSHATMSPATFFKMCREFVILAADYLPRPNIRRVDSEQALVEFVESRSAYIAQTALFGYLKTRMGTSFRFYFEDKGFSGLIREASGKLFLSCVSDLTIFSVAIANERERMSAKACAELARNCFFEAAQRGLANVREVDLTQDVLDVFSQRVETTDWHEAARGRNAFSGSEGDLIRFAPVVDQFKRLDREIVTNSIRFRWRDVREQVRKRIDAKAIWSDWRALGEESDPVHSNASTSARTSGPI